MVKFVILCACLMDVVIWTLVNSYGPLVILIQGPKTLKIILLVRDLSNVIGFATNMYGATGTGELSLAVPR